MTDSDVDLLKHYARDNAQDAFAEIVRRHLGLVHTAALRQVRSPQLAEEVAQSVFTDLARQSPRLAPDTILSAWLYEVTRRTAIDVVRREARRQLREQIATEMNVMHATAADWTHIEPLLDEAMHALDETDRAAVLLRYFENKSLREVGQALGTSDDTAQKRVSRAVERLREYFAQRGVTVGASGLVVVISANAVQAAPIGLAVTISTAATFAGTTFVTATATAIKAIAMTTLQKTLIAAALVAVSVGTSLVVQHRANGTMRAEHAALRAQTNQLAGMEELRVENQRLAKLQTDADEFARLRKDQTELLRLRGEVGVLRRQVAEAVQREAQRGQEAARTMSAIVQPKAEVPAGSIRFIFADALKMILPFYAELAGLELDVHPKAVDHPAQISIDNDRGMTRSEAIGLVEQALREQAGLVVRRSGGGRAAVYFDESVMTKPVKRE